VSEGNKPKGSKPASRKSFFTSPTVIDLFAGAGGVTSGLKIQGYKVVAAIDVDPKACLTYQLNNPEVTVLTADVLSLNPRDLLRLTRLRPGQLDVLTACAPCQPFSSLFLGRANRGEKRTKLVERVGDFVAALRPKIVLVENVPPLMMKPEFRKLCRRLLGLKYRLKAKVIDAADFGVPQRRRRLVLLATQLSHCTSVPDITPGHPALRHWRMRRTVREAFSRLRKISKNDPLSVVVPPKSLTVRKRIAAIPKNGGSRSSLPPNLQLKCHRKLPVRNTRAAGIVYGRMKWDDIAPTLTTRCTTPACGRFLHPALNRPITLREAALLQTFPANYVFAGGRLSIEAQIGNAVPPRLAAAIGAIIRYELGTR
jgi:DNA (cytosine-5)-methyltransferase 1